jgi:adenylate cyclase class 2
MSASDQEFEVKFYLSNLPALEERLKALGAQLVQPRIHEVNLRFDTPGRELAASYRVLRLRQDSKARLTYKGPGREQDGVRLRQELEFTVGDFEMARALLEALGYAVFLMYEKYRATYALGAVLVTLDEMPYGNFAEIEGPDSESIRAAAKELGLNWEARILDSYTALFDRLRSVLGLAFRDLSFENFKFLKVTIDALGVIEAGSMSAKDTR